MKLFLHTKMVFELKDDFIVFFCIYIIFINSPDVGDT